MIIVQCFDLDNLLKKVDVYRICLVNRLKIDLFFLHKALEPLPPDHAPLKTLFFKA